MMALQAQSCLEIDGNLATNPGCAAKAIRIHREAIVEFISSRMLPEFPAFSHRLPVATSVPHQQVSKDRP